MEPNWRENPRLIPDLDFVQRHVEAAAAYISSKYTTSTLGVLRHMPVESPIEAVFYAWWGALLYTHEISEDYFGLVKQHDVSVGGRRYRLDFAIEPNSIWKQQAADTGVSVPKIAIELDGHDFHERTKEQVAIRNERDRALQGDGWCVLHFSGSELNMDPHGCVHGVYGQAYIAYWRMEDAISTVHVEQAFREREAAERAADKDAAD